MASPLKIYAFINAKLRARISKLLPEETFKSLIKSRSMHEALNLLKDTAYAELETLYSSTGDLKMGEMKLFSNEIQLIKEVERHVNGAVAELVRTLALKYEIENLKQALRLWFDRVIRKRSIDERVGYLCREAVINPIDVDRIINQETLEGVTGELGDTPYGAILSAATAEIKSKLTLFPLELALDRYYYNQLMEAVENLSPKDRSIAKRHVLAEIDLENLNWLTRFKDFYKMQASEIAAKLLPWGGMRLSPEEVSRLTGSKGTGDIVSDYISREYGELKPMLSVQTTGVYNRLALMERLFQEIMLTEIRHMLYGYPFSIGVILAYVSLKRMEMKKIMSVLNAQFYEFSEARMTGLL